MVGQVDFAPDLGVLKDMGRPELLAWCKKHKVKMDGTKGKTVILDEIAVLVHTGKIKQPLTKVEPEPKD